jgi:hypothetical protein
MSADERCGLCCIAKTLITRLTVSARIAPALRAARPWQVLVVFLCMYAGRQWRYTIRTFGPLKEAIEPDVAAYCQGYH